MVVLAPRPSHCSVSAEAMGQAARCPGRRLCEIWHHSRLHKCGSFNLNVWTDGIVRAFHDSSMQGRRLTTAEQTRPGVKS
jgi:hypothetical protein